MLVIYLFALFFLIRVVGGDDTWFQSSDVHNMQDLIDFLGMRYMNWSSRLCSEAVIIVLVRLNMMVWRLCCVAAILLIALSMRYLAGIGSSLWKNIFLCLLVASFPLSYYMSAGWITTTSVYLMSAALGIFALIPIRKAAEGKTYTWPECILYIVSALVASNQEQMCALLIGFYLCTIAYFLISQSKQKIHWIHAGVLFVCILNVIFFVSCPGIPIRVAQETEMWMPEYVSWSVFHKFLYGFLHAADCLFYEKKLNIVMLILVFIFAILVIKKVEQKWKKAAAIADVLWTCLVAGVILLQRLGLIGNVFQWGEYGQNMLASGNDIARAVSAVILLAFLFCELFWLFGNTLQFWISSVIFAAGIASVVMVGFSPTIYASGTRIFIFCDYAILTMAAYVVSELCPDECGKTEKTILIITGLFAVAQAAWTLSRVI